MFAHFTMVYFHADEDQVLGAPVVHTHGTNGNMRNTRLKIFLLFDSAWNSEGCFADVYLYGHAVQGESSVKRSLQQAHGIGVEE